MAQAPAPSALRAGLARFARPGVPKYVAMRDAIADKIASGEWPGGTRLAPESEYAAALPLSLGTIQRALRALAEEGLITRRQGRGSFVAADRAGRMHDPLHCRFLDDAGRGYLPVYPRILRRYEETRAGPWSHHLGARRIVCIERVIRVASEFRVFSRFWFDPVRLPALATLPLRSLSAENFKEVIWRETGQLVGRISTYLSMVTLPADVCRAIGVRRATRGMLLELSAHVGRDSPVYHQELSVPPGRRRMHLAAGPREPGP
jgi:DNA-binding GntR family transcriptional regulator